ncbi:MAG: hypothetical protein E7600_08660 [Ruminococcaceae bacterium]|nr:hypothetical protein [Oscillospiraceae bacterium]
MAVRNLKEGRIRLAVFVTALLLAVLCMFLIYGFSSDNAVESTVQSHAVTEFLIRIFNPDFENMSAEVQERLISELDGVVRKAAHFTIYALLGFLTYITVGSYKLLPERKLLPCIVSIPVCVLFSLSDEFHQTFVDGRAGQFSDIIIDSLGSVFGTVCAILTVAVVFTCIKRRKRI